MHHRGRPLKASLMQRAMAYAGRRTPGLYIQQQIRDFTGSFQPEVWTETWRLLCQSHQVLRASFEWAHGGDLLVRFEDEVSPSSRYMDLSGLPAPVRIRQAEDFLEQDRRTAFEIERPPLIRSTVIRLQPDLYRTVITFHHLLLDGRSWVTLANEALDLYKHLTSVASEEDAKPAAPVCEVPQERPFSDFLRSLELENLDEVAGFWRGYLHGVEPAPGLHAPGRSKDNTRQGAHFRFTAEESRKIRESVEAAGLHLSGYALAAWAIVFQRYALRKEQIIGTVRHGRAWSFGDPRTLVGMFINTVPVRVRIDEQESVHSLVSKLRDDWRITREFERTPLPLIHETCDIPLGAELLDSLYMYEEDDASHPDFLLRERAGKLSISVRVGDHIDAEIECDPPNEASDLGSEMLASWCRVFRQVTSHPEQRISEIDALDPAEVCALVDLGRGRTMPVPPGTVVDRFLQHAAASPNALAVAAPQGVLTYAQLRDNAAKVSAELRRRGVRKGDYAVIVCEASLNLIEAELGVLFTGAAFIPVDPSTPADRILSIVRDSKAPALISQRPLDGLPSECARIGIQEIPDLPADRLFAPVLPDATDIAYVIYTSGSTGQPKGVMIEHRSLMNLVGHHRSELGIDSSFRSSLISGVAFDASMTDIWPYLTSGASVHIPPPAVRVDPDALREWITNTCVRVSFIPTAIAELMIDADWSAAHDFRFFLTGGDKLHRAGRLPQPFRLINTYGPTETTVDATWSDVVPFDGPSTPPPIGRPIANFLAVVLDPETLRPVPRGLPGILFLGGLGVASGYLNRPDLTAQRFVPNPWGPGNMYDTGDRVYWNEAGVLEFLGRNDGQVQLRGFRIETEEVAFHLRTIPGVRHALVVLKTLPDAGPILLAGLVVESGIPRPAVSDVVSSLASRLPSYMIPSRYIFLDEVPLTPNGKADFGALTLERAEPVTDSFESYKDSLEAQIGRIFGKALGSTHFARTANLFDSGVDSLGLVNVLLALHDATGAQLRLPDLFRHPTVEQLAAYLRTSQAVPAVSDVLVALSSRGEYTPLFCVPGAGGGVHWFFDFAAALEWECPLYGLEPMGLLTENVDDLTVPSLASEFLRAMRQVQPRGPYQLCGFSLGGVIALEIVRQLTAVGEHTTWLGLIESYGEGTYEKGVARLRIALRNFGRMNIARKSEFLLRKAKWVSQVVGGKRSAAAQAVADSEEASFAHQLTIAQTRSGYDYLTSDQEPWNGDASILVCRNGPLTAPGPPYFGWRRLISGNIDVHEVPGDHYTVLAPPNVAAVASLCAELVKRRRRSSSGP